MTLTQKIEILGDAAKYDVACTSSGIDRKASKGKIGNATAMGICHSWAADGRCISLLKVLKTNVCKYDCAYCHNRRSNDIPRATFTAKELAELTIEFYRRNYIEGLFLSSAIPDSPDATMEQLIKTIEYVREVGNFGGYIHAKTIPGANPLLIERLGRLCDRISVNIELPSESSLKLLAPDKSRQAILTPMKYIGRRIDEAQSDSQYFKSAPSFAPAGQSTQLIVGATGESDRQILSLSQGLYRQYGMKRVFYSAYMPINHGSNLPDLPHAPLLREHRLYQSDWLLRFYGFTAEELLDPARPNLDPRLDPKCGWALRNLDRFPVEVNTADMATLLRVPGIGVKGAQRIVAARRVGALTAEGLKKLGIVMKRARHFITVNGRYQGNRIDEQPIRAELTTLDNTPQSLFNEQLSFLEPPVDDWTMVKNALADVEARTALPAASVSSIELTPTSALALPVGAGR